MEGSEGTSLERMVSVSPQPLLIMTSVLFGFEATCREKGLGGFGCASGSMVVSPLRIGKMDQLNTTTG